MPFAALTRVSREGYVNALQEVFGDGVVSDLETVLDAIPSAHIGHFRTELGAASHSEVSAQFHAAFAVAKHVTRDTAALASLSECLPNVGDGATPQSEPCLTEFIESYGQRILRRPLSDEDRDRLAGDYAVGSEHGVGEGVATVLASMLIDPDFLYDRAVGEGEGDVLKLTPHETAARLARALWNSAPDAQLLAAADAGLDQASLRAEAERMIDDPRARVALGGFFFDWLELEKVPFPSEESVEDADAREALRKAMRDSVTEFGTSTVLDGDGTYAELLTDRTAYVNDATLAAIYGVSVSAGPVELPADRAGLLTRAGFVSTSKILGTNAGHIIKRGARTSAFICRELHLPENTEFPNDPAEPGENPTLGIRERFQEVTSEAACFACHLQLDGLGAPFGHYGPLGEWIDEEVVGDGVALPIDVSSEVLIDGEFVAVDSPVALSEALASSTEGPTCLARNLARNMLGRETTKEDRCLIGQLALALSGEDEAGSPTSVREALVDFVVSNRFRHVRTQ